MTPLRLPTPDEVDANYYCRGHAPTFYTAGRESWGWRGVCVYWPALECYMHVEFWPVRSRYADVIAAVSPSTIASEIAQHHWVPFDVPASSHPELRVPAGL